MNPLIHRQPSMLPLALAILLSSVISFSCHKESNPGTPKQTAAAPPTGPGTHPPPPRPLVWVRMADLPFTDAIAGDVPVGLEGQNGFAINGKGYLCAGETYTSSGQPEVLNNLWEYDTASKAWTQKANYPGGRNYTASNFVVGSAAYIQVGNANWQYNQPTNTWTRKADMPGDSRGNASAFAIGGNGYVGFGFDLTVGGVLSDFYRYETAADRWLPMPAFPGIGRGGAMSFAVDSFGYICSGVNFTTLGPFVYLADLWQFDPGTRTWTAKQAFPGNARALGVGLSGPGHGFVGTGSDGAGDLDYFKDFYEYTPSSNTWTRLPDMGTARIMDASFFIGSNLYVAGGTSGVSVFKDFWTLHL